MPWFPCLWCPARRSIFSPLCSTVPTSARKGVASVQSAARSTVSGWDQDQPLDGTRYPAATPLNRLADKYPFARYTWPIDRATSLATPLRKFASANPSSRPVSREYFKRDHESRTWSQFGKSNCTKANAAKSGVKSLLRSEASSLQVRFQSAIATANLVSFRKASLSSNFLCILMRLAPSIRPRTPLSRCSYIAELAHSPILESPLIAPRRPADLLLIEELVFVAVIAPISSR